MTRTEDRLTDALTAAARAVPQETLRPLIAPPARRRQPAWLAPAAAALGIVLVVGVALAVGSRVGRSGAGFSAAAAGAAAVLLSKPAWTAAGIPVPWSGPRPPAR